MDNMTQEQNIINYFKFIAELFNIDKIDFELEQIKDNSNIINKNILSIDYLTFKPNSDTTIKILMEKWINDNIFKNNEYQSNLYNIYSLSNIPTYIIIHINRDEDTENNKAKIDIMKRIKFYNGLDTQNYLKWNLQSIICYDKTYYTIVYNNKNSILFNNKFFPSFTHLNINDDEIKDKIMAECVMLVYTLNDI
jgi:hypothetical protein